MKRLTMEHHGGNDRENDERDDFLNDLQLHETERSAVAFEPYAVGGNLTTVFREGNKPREQYYSYERPMTRNATLLQFEMAVPSQCHENIAAYQQQNSIYNVHSMRFLFYSFAKVTRNG